MVDRLPSSTQRPELSLSEVNRLHDTVATTDIQQSPTRKGKFVGLAAAVAAPVGLAGGLFLLSPTPNAEASDQWKPCIEQSANVYHCPTFGATVREEKHDGVTSIMASRDGSTTTLEQDEAGTNPREGHWTKKAGHNKIQMAAYDWGSVRPGTGSLRVYEEIVPDVPVHVIADPTPKHEKRLADGWDECTPGKVARCEESMTTLGNKRTDMSPGGVTFLELTRDDKDKTVVPADYAQQLPANEYQSKLFQAGDVNCIVKGNRNPEGTEVFAKEKCVAVGE